MHLKPTRWKPEPAAPAAAQPSLADWQVLMRAGVEHVSGGRFAHADRCYAEALAIARALLLRSIAGDEAEAGAERVHDDRVAAFVVTRLNMADLCMALGERHAAVAHRCIAHRTLMTLLRSDKVAPALQQAALRHSRQTHVALLDHVAVHGSHPDVDVALRTAPQPAATFH